MSTVKISKFEEKVISRIEEEKSDVKIGAKNAKVARSIAEGQIAVLKGKLIDDENNLEEAVEHYDSVVYPVVKISNRNEYWQSVVNAEDLVEQARQSIKDTKDSIKSAEKFIKDNF